jgi:DNA replicative helicase MCM subunit Mcm2 (Cdc46/Mcm family)
LSTLLKTARPEDVFQDLFRTHETDQTGSKYRKRLAQVAVTNGKSLVIDFDDLISFDPALARSLVEKPDDYITYASSAATAQMRVEDPEYAEHVGKIFARFRRLPEKTALRKIGAEHIKKIALVDGIVVRTTQVKPTIVSAVFRCRKCLEIIVQDQEGELIRGPGSHCPFCKQSTSFELIQEQSKFKNTQEARIQERPEDLPPGQLPRYLDIRLEDDLVDSARPGDRVSVTSIVRAEKQTVGERGRLRTFNIYLDANFVDVVGKETEVVEITPEDEKQILEAAQDPWVQRKLVMSLAPSIYGYEDVKEGILYMLFGGVAKHLPDGVNIRGDQNTLLIGDPGCLIGDERIILGDGAISKIQDLGKDHLEEMNVPVLTGLGGAERDVATRFHVYHDQPTIEIVTESGKSIRGTYNHPLLCVEKDGSLVRRWKRLDEFKVGDRVAVVTGFPCYIRRLVDTRFLPLPYKLGPRFQGRLPDKVTPDLGAFLGYVLGDGWVQKYRVGFLVADGEKDLLKPLCDMAEKLFGVKPRVKERIIAGRKVLMHHAVIGRRDIAANLSFLREKRVPDLILRSGDEVVAQFLRWLYEADGTVFSSKRGCGAIGLKAKDIELLRDVQILLLRFGIHSRIIGNALLTRRGESILKFARRIGFASNKKQTRLAHLEDRAKRLKRLTKQRSERIVAIYNREPADVYDIEVPRTHRFIANGIVSHNTAKSQLLQYVSRIAPRGLYTSGRGTTAAGLTAAVLREKTGGMILEAGALVLADKGVACIDELDKMRPDDRVAIHEALEQQTVSVAKGGIVATLNARAAVLAAANPSLGRYEPHRNVSENINLPVTILSRFDLIFIIKDQPEPDYDSRMSEHILSLHRSKVSPETAPFAPEFLRKYISFAKRIIPVLTPEAITELRDFYLKMRSKGGEEAAVAITPRQLEALVRISEARARAFLRENVTVEDAKSAIRIMTVSLSDVGVDVKTGTMDIDVIMTGKPRSLRDSFQRVIETVAEMERETGTVEETVLVAALVDKEKMEEREARRLIGQLIKEGILYSPKPGRLKRTAG